MTTRESDARTEVEEFEESTSPIVYRDLATGRTVDPDKISRVFDRSTGRSTNFTAPKLSPQEEAEIAKALRGALDAGQVRYPQLANTLLNDPSKLWLMGEIQMMLSPEENPVSYDFTSDLMEGLTTTTAQRTEYEFRTAHEETQQLFWHEIGSKYEQDDRDFLINALAQLSPEGANRVGAQALAWSDNNDIKDEETKAQLFLNVANWSAMEQEHELGMSGIFGFIDELQEGVEQNIISPLVNAGVGLLSGAEEAARRRDLTPGQQMAYQFGIRPPENAGDFGWWAFTSGAADALIEIGGDPLAWIAGLGAGLKAVKTIPVATKATKSGRALAAVRAVLPKPLAGTPKVVRGGRFARVTYALGSKSVDDLLQKTVQNGIADDALQLIKQGNLSRFGRLYPAWRGMSDETIRTIQEAVQSPEEFIEVMKSSALNEVLRTGTELDDLTRNAQQSEQAMREIVGDVGQVVDGVIDDSATLLREVTERPDDFIYHATSAKNDAAIQGTTFGQGTWAHTREVAENYYRSHASELGEGAVIQAYRKSDLPPNILQRVEQNIEQGGDVTTIVDRLPPMFNEAGETVKIRPAISYPAREGLQEIAEGNKVANFVAGPDGTIRVLGEGQTNLRTFDDLLTDQNIPRDLRLQAAKDRLSLNAYNLSNSQTFILSEVPQKSKRIFSWQRILERTKGSGRLATGVRRTVARSTPGRIPNEIELQNTRKGVDDLRRIGEHFGVKQDVLDDLAQEFTELEAGARQDWIWDTFLRRIGRETGVPAFEHQLVQFYKGAGVRNFSASGVDLLPGGKRIPMLPTQMTDKMPVPVEIMNSVFNRARSIGTRSRLARAMGMNGRGLGKTKGRRMELVQRLRRELGEQAQELTDDQLYDMAFSLVSPNTGLDGRGIWAGKMLPKAGSWANQLHQWFTKSMLVFRPIQWMWRVALLEEPIRAHLFNLPSLYSNPLQYMGRMREAHYLWNVGKWAEANMSWGQDVLSTLTRGGREQIIERVTGLGLADDIFSGDIPDSARGVRTAVERYVGNALYGRTRPSKLNPVKRVPWAVKNRAHSIKKAEKTLKKLDLPDAFDFHEAAQPINQRLVSGYLGEVVGSSQRKMYQWQPGLTNDEAFTHGRVYGAKLIEFVEDPFGRAALRRRAAILRGETPDITGHDLVNSSRWPQMAPDLRIKYANEPDDLAVAERYLDDMLSQEIEHLFKPFVNELSADELADLLDDFATTRRITATVGGQDVDWDLRSANFGAGVRQVGDFTASVRRDPTVELPGNLPAPSMDGRFMAEDDPGLPSRMANWVLQTFGENATQTLNRRPAWLSVYKRHFDNYRALDVPVEHAQQLATDHANKMVNHVFFNMDEAPYYVARLNRVLPFFGATYEVLGTWSYKLPVEVGGTWPAGIGEFTRKFDRLIDGLVNVGLLTREENRDGTISLTLNLVPPDNEMASQQEFGRALQGAGFAAVNTLDQAVSTLLNLEEGLGLRSQGYRLAAGHPLNPTDYGILSFAQADVGLNPATNIAVTALAGRIPGATAPRREAVQPGETLADAAERLNVDVDELVRYNREVFIDTEDFGSSDLYNGLLGGQIDPEELVLPDLAVINLPGSSLWDAMSDTFMPFGEISSPHEFGVNFIPSAFRWALAGLALQNQPTDKFWADNDLEGMFGGILPPINQAQVASQLNEAFMYLEAHDIVEGKGPLTRIQEKEQRLAELPDDAFEERNTLRKEIDLDTQAFLDRAQKVAAESLILRGLTGQMLPTTPGHVRLEEQKIRDFWDTREYADSIKAGEGEAKLRNFKSMDEVENYKEQLAAWLNDPTADRARAVFRANNPQLMAYLTPKTFYKGNAPDIESYQEYQRQIESGEREPAPLHVTMWRARSASIQADYYNKYIAEFGNDPQEAAAQALQNREVYQQLNDERDLAYQALEMWDDMHGSIYDNWREENYADVETWAQDQINDKLNKVRDNLGILFELDDNLDIELDLEGIANLNGSIRGAIAEISNAIRDYNELTEQTNTRNDYEAAINQYFEEVYIPYAERISELYDQLPEVADTERQSLIYEQIKFVKNEYANSLVFLNGDTSNPFPTPLEYSWQGKDEEEQTIKMQQWVTRPIEWMDLDQAQRIMEASPEIAPYLPNNHAAFDIYREYTLQKVTLDEMFEANEITRSVRNKAIKNLDEQLRRHLVESGRGREVLIMDMTPYEKLELSGFLPGNLGIFGDHVRYYKQVLEQTEQTPGTVAGRQIVAPLFDMVEQQFFADPNMRKTLQELGINLQDETAMDSFLPWLFFGYTGER